MATAEVCLPARDLFGDVLRLEGEARRTRGVGGQASKDARGRGPQAKEAAGQADARVTLASKNC